VNEIGRFEDAGPADVDRQNDDVDRPDHRVLGDKQPACRPQQRRAEAGDSDDYRAKQRHRGPFQGTSEPGSRHGLHGIEEGKSGGSFENARSLDVRRIGINSRQCGSLPDFRSPACGGRLPKPLRVVNGNAALPARLGLP